MNDPHIEITAKVKELMKLKSNEERLLMGFSMYDTAKEIVKSSIIERNPHMTVNQMRREIFLRFYGVEFTKDSRDKIFI